MSGRLLTARHVAERLNLKTQTILAWVRAGKLPAYRLPSGQLRFREDDLDVWLAQHRTLPQESRATLTPIKPREEH